MNITVKISVQCSNCGTSWFDYRAINTDAYVDKYHSFVIYEKVDEILPKHWKLSKDGKSIYCPRCQ